MRRTILVIEDDASVRDGIVDALQYAGHATLEATDADNGRKHATRGTYDLLLLDLVLPGGDGLEILEAVRRARPTVPVIILTARGDERDRIAGLKLGADDYVVKPFSVKELLARVEAVLRRSPQRPSDVGTVTFPGRAADLERREIRFDDGRRHELSDREAALLRYLSANAGRAVSREELLAHVWQIDPAGVATRTIDMHVARLREKLGDDGAEPHLLLTVRGKGYMIAHPESSS